MHQRRRLCDQGLSSSVLGDGNCLGGSNKYSGQLTPSIYLTGSTSTVRTIFEPVNGRCQKLIPFSSRPQHVTKLKKDLSKICSNSKNVQKIHFEVFQNKKNFIDTNIVLRSFIEFVPQESV